MRKALLYAVLANLLFWGFIGLVMITNGWALVALLILFVVIVIGMIGASTA